MRQIITMVGTSLFENFFKNVEESNLESYYEEINELRSDEWENEKGRIERLKKGITKWLNEIDQDEKINASAEIKSLFKLKQVIDDDFYIYLFSSDTIVSKLASKVIKEVLNELQLGKIHTEMIKGLQIWDKEEFKKGMSDLISKIYEVADGYWNNVIINITGGFKATIPFLTILAQLNNCPLYYIFEDTDSLIEIPKIPFSKEIIDWKEIDKYFEWFVKLDEGIDNESEYHKLKNEEFYSKYSFLIWEEEHFAELNPIGKIIFEKYKEKCFVYYITEDAKKMIENSLELQNVFRKFTNKQIRKNKTEDKNGHFVFDDGNNPFRIYYREKNGIIYIYKAFFDHNEHDRYWKNTPYSNKIFENMTFKLEKLFLED